MKTTAQSSLKKFAGLAVFASALLLAACSDTRDTSATTTATSATDAKMVDASATWDSIKGYSYDKKTEFAAKAGEVAAKLEADAATATGAASAKLSEARDELRTATTEVATATADTWEATKERVGRALQKAETAYSSAAE
jgi:hypothetical protein